MSISKIFVSIMQYISEAVMRIFSPSDDAYPMIGVQPFTGEFYKRRTANGW
ncbi:nicotinate phosphoribosyltransferase [Nodularia sp. UHCC 0506]|uniref:nicotinate phosphoribosyltransferase n=1 Tax=Nodularia sp. UHCC 0506 TaxID=3110243 RepID=UPI002B20B6A0|nr:nicotinate phosphoribosyltransferase [Nodularia sp. UHCC 0506]MEA5516285.1 nicotinate phosphoribosyltransferase [Nodularia sp. UHCC 0506]